MSEEKYHKLKNLKERFMCIVETQINGDISKLNAKELGEVVDMIKDCAEAMKECAEAEYYEKITKAMDENSISENAYYMKKYAPETMGNMRYFRSRPPMMYYTRDGRKYYSHDGRRYFRDEIEYPYWEMGDYDRDMDRDDHHMNRMYYTNTDGSYKDMGYEKIKDKGMNNDSKYNQSYDAYTVNRRTYMDMKASGADKTQTMEEIKKTMSSLADTLMPVMQKATPEEKSIIKQNLNSLVSKIG